MTSFDGPLLQECRHWRYANPGSSIPDYFVEHCNLTGSFAVRYRRPEHGGIVQANEYECDGYLAPYPYRTLNDACLNCNYPELNVAAQATFFCGAYALACVLLYEFIRAVDETFSPRSALGPKLASWKGTRVALAFLGVLFAALSSLTMYVAAVL